MDDCMVTTDLNFVEEFVTFIENGLSGTDVIEWCDDNIMSVADLYKKYWGTKDSYYSAIRLLFYIQSIHDRDDIGDMVRKFLVSGL
jgi:hypothetical protein|uniref:Uncharacterized protein n=1 Tax=Mantoniella tinhauana virus 1 TaxID=3111543 RepID=A0AB38ZM62_9VIRU